LRGGGVRGRRRQRAVALLAASGGVEVALPLEALAGRQHEPTPDAPVERRLALEDAMDLHDAVGDLPPELRECVVLRYYGSLGTDEIASRLGISRRAVQKKLERAHGRLRRRLGSRTATAVAWRWRLALPAVAGVLLLGVAALRQDAGGNTPGASSPHLSRTGRRSCFFPERGDPHRAPAIVAADSRFAIRGLPATTSWSPARPPSLEGTRRGAH
jgi:hypothetical protein